MPSNLEIVRTYLGALESGEYETARALLHPDVVLDLSGSDIPERGLYEGLEGIERFSAGWKEVWKEYGQVLKHLVDVPPDGVLAMAEEYGSSTSGITLEGQQIADLYTLRDGRIVRVYEYPTWRGALEALDLPPPTDPSSSRGSPS